MEVSSTRAAQIQSTQQPMSSQKAQLAALKPSNSRRK
ncbi:hypothetical protein M2244_000172 [Rhodoferax antarcticus]|nr:hypothetical protein [Rhodoferax antarcticus]